MDGSFGFLGGEDESAFSFGVPQKSRCDDEIIGIGLHFFGRLKE